MKTILILSVCLINTAFSAKDYYFRVFTGTVPTDAFTLNEVYVGNAPREHVGLLIGELHSGINSITTSGPNDGSVNILTRYIQILCSKNPENLSWVAATSSTVLSVNNPVIGGYEHNAVSGEFNGILYIGRVQVEDGQYRFGKVAAYHVQDGYEYQNVLYVATSSNEETFEEFEVLTYSA